MGRKSIWVVVAVIAALIAIPAACSAAPLAMLSEPTPVSGGYGWLVWSVPVPGGWGLEAEHGGAVRPLAVAARPQPFDVSVGTDARGRAVLTFSRCAHTPSYSYGSADERGGILLLPRTGAGCRLRVLAPGGGTERALPVPHPAGSSDTTPSMSHGSVAFARHAPGHGNVWQVLLYSPRHPHRLTLLPHGAEPVCPARSCGEPNTGDVEALSFRAGTVAFIWGPEGPNVIGEEAWEDRVDHVATRSGALAGSQLGIESCTGFAPVEETYPLPPIAGPTSIFPFYERGSCYKTFGTGILAYRAGHLRAGTLDRPLWALASDGRSYYGLFATPPASPGTEALCSAAAPCALETLSLPALKREPRKPRHPFT
jgi:hypothetical protein